MIDENELIKYVQSVDSKRNKQWVDVSQKFSQFDPFLIVTIQGLGTLDSKLVIADKKVSIPKSVLLPTGDLSDHITLSYLWVLGAYEVIRSLHQRTNENKLFFPKHKNDLMKLKHQYERIRMPLAKFEAAKRYSKTDSHIAYPGFHKELGVAWQVSKDTWVTRRSLSDDMLSLFEKMQA